MLFLSCICYAFVHLCLLMPCGTSWLSFVMSNCEFVTLPLVSCVRCGCLIVYRFLIFPLFVTFSESRYLVKPETWQVLVHNYSLPV